MTNIQEIAKKVIDPYTKMTDYELREELKGCGFFTAMFAKQYYEPGTTEYNELYKQIYEPLSQLSEKCYLKTKDFEFKITYKQTGKPETFGYTFTVTERTEEEAMKRAKSKQFKNLRTNRVIKPEFINITITQK